MATARRATIDDDGDGAPGDVNDDNDNGGATGYNNDNNGDW